MPTSFQNSLERLRGGMVELLWQQWTCLGVAGHAGPEENTIIDPEALVLATTWFGRYDSRLMDEAIDWLWQFGEQVSLQRLQGLEKQWPGVAEPRVRAAIAEVLCRQASHRKWERLAHQGNEGIAPESLFRSRDGLPVSVSGEMDPLFARHGLLRGKLELRGMSQAPDPANPRNLLFTLRSLLGVNARAEIMGWLLTHESGHPAAIARSTGYFSKSIQQILNEMSASGQIRSVRMGREKYFSLQHREIWQELLLPPSGERATMTQWFDWMPYFEAIRIFAETLDQPGLAEKSEQLQSIRFREALDRATPALAQAGRLYQMRANREMRGQVLIETLLADIESLVLNSSPASRA